MGANKIEELLTDRQANKLLCFVNCYHKYEIYILCKQFNEREIHIIHSNRKLNEISSLFGNRVQNIRC